MEYYEYPAQSEEVKKRLFNEGSEDPAIRSRVLDIINTVREQGDKGVLELTRKFDGVDLAEEEMRIPEQVLEKSWNEMSEEIKSSIEIAARRIRRFHEPQKPAGYTLEEATGGKLEYRISPLSSVGLYVPGGTAAYPSSLLMNAIPATVAGVEKIVVVTPPGQEGNPNTSILGTAYFLGIKEVYCIGGAQAVAALAFGTGVIPRVDKVVGPGNAYVAEAKRLLYGVIDIDMIAGPSEILVIADETAPLSYIISDLLSQAEHDVMAVTTLIYIGKMDREAFEKELEERVISEPRQDFIRKALEGYGTVVEVETSEDAVSLANMKAPEHLEVMTKEPEKILPGLKNAGAIFVGQYTPEPVGDYVAGPNHVLPTLGTARFFSPLSVTDFMKGTSILNLTEKDLDNLGPEAIRLAELEGLSAHANSIRIRLK